MSDLVLTNASTGKRFANFLIDYIMILILLIVLLALYVIVTKSPNILNNTEDAMYNVIFISGYVLYYFVCEFFFKGKTIGKLITKTRALSEDGNLLTPKQAILRSLSRLVPFETISIFFGNGGNLTWHDKWTDTIVIDEKESNWEINRLV